MTTEAKTVTIVFKTITQLTFEDTFDSNQTIADVKKKIADERGEDFAVELQKLIYNGKILTDETSVEGIGYESGKFIVVMLSRKKQPEPAPAPAAAAAEPTPAPAPTPAATPAAASAAAPAAVPSANLTADQQEKLDNVMGMGYTRDQGIRALTLADWDANRAVNLLLSGSDDFESAPVAGLAGEAEEEQEERAASLEDIAHLPQFEELRNLIRSNPSALPELMREIAQHNPELMQAISQNQGAFLQMMTGGGGSGAARQSGPARGPAQEDNLIRLSAEEHAAIQRIKAMGLNVPDALIVEAYIACDKNEELAVSYIMDAMDQFGQDQ